MPIWNECQNTWKTHCVGAPLFGLQWTHTRAYPAISLIAGLYTPRNTFHDHMALDIEGYLISVNRFYRRSKYWKHFRLLRDLGRVVFQVDIKLQRTGVIFQNAPTDRYMLTAPPLSSCFSVLRKLIHRLISSSSYKLNYQILSLLYIPFILFL